MSLVFERADRAPATHALIIGVGDYFHLRGGSDPRPGTLADDIDVLNSPQVSAASFARWLIGVESELATPLGTVELLIGNGTFPGEGGADTELEKPTRANLERAAERWYERCDSNEENIGIFYFCGHGIRDDARHTLLLAQDFGESQRRFWANGFNFSKTYEAMAGCRAFTQLYLIDACRVSPKEWLEQDTSLATGLLATPKKLDRSRDGQILYGTSGNDFAYGNENSESRFTRALLDCLTKYAATKVGANYMITTDSLAKAMLVVSNPPRFLERRGRVERGGESSETTKLLPLESPKVKARFFGKPEDYLSIAKLTCAQGQTSVAEHGPNQSVPYEFDIGIGAYRFALTQSGQQIDTVDLEADVPALIHVWEKV